MLFQAHSQVFQWNSKNFELIQLLPDEHIIDLTHYVVGSTHGSQYFLVLISSNRLVQVYWWNGRRFSSWLTKEAIYDPKNVLVGKIANESIMYIQSKVSIL